MNFQTFFNKEIVQNKQTNTHKIMLSNAERIKIEVTSKTKSRKNIKKSKETSKKKKKNAGLEYPEQE